MRCKLGVESGLPNTGHCPTRVYSEVFCCAPRQKCTGRQLDGEAMTGPAKNLIGVSGFKCHELLLLFLDLPVAESFDTLTLEPSGGTTQTNTPALLGAGTFSGGSQPPEGAFIVFWHSNKGMIDSQGNLF